MFPPDFLLELRKDALTKKHLIALYSLCHVHQDRVYLPITNVMTEPITLSQGLVAALSEQNFCSDVATLESCLTDNVSLETALEPSFFEMMISE